MPPHGLCPACGMYSALHPNPQLPWTCLHAMPDQPLNMIGGNEFLSKVFIAKDLAIAYL